MAQYLERRISVEYELLDLTSLPSVYAAGKRLRERLQVIDATILNAGIGGFTGMDWPRATWYALTDLVQSVTWPTTKRAAIGLVARPQLASRSVPETQDSVDGEAEPPLGEVFCANVFGHHILTHTLMPSLRRSRVPGGARIVWVSSLEADAHAFNVADFQSLRTNTAYEGSKRLTDLLALTADMPEASPYTKGYFSGDDDGDGDDADARPRQRPRVYLSHPGICATGIMPLALPLTWAMVAIFYLARWLGSIWHTISAYKGATAPVWLALAPLTAIAAVEKEGGGPGKWGSATDRQGEERVERTETEGWGYGATMGDSSRRKGRKRGAIESTRESREGFVQLGRECWAKIEELRREWEETLR